MWLWYDWRAAAIADAHGNIVDIASWDGHMTEHAIVQRLSQVEQGIAIPEVQVLLNRFPEAKVCLHGDPELPEADWPFPDDEAQEMADKAALRMAIEGVQRSASDPDRRLEHLVRGSDELRASHLTMEAHLIEWAGLFFPMAVVTDRQAFVACVAQSETPADFAQRMELVLPQEQPSPSEWASIHEWAADTSQAQSRLDRLEHALRLLASEHLPSVTALLGPLLAARLCVEAHGQI